MSCLVVGHGTDIMSMSLAVCRITSVIKTYMVTSMGLITHNKRLQILDCSALFKDIQSRGGIPKKSISLGDFGEIPFVTIGDTAFPRLEWLLKCFNENTRDLKERYCNKRLYVVQGLSQKTFMVW